jgi:hypothetical protein
MTTTASPLSDADGWIHANLSKGTPEYSDGKGNPVENIPIEEEYTLRLLHLRLTRGDLCDKLYDKSDCPTDDVSIYCLPDGKFMWKRERMCKYRRLHAAFAFAANDPDDIILAKHDTKCAFLSKVTKEEE